MNRDFKQLHSKPLSTASFWQIIKDGSRQILPFICFFIPSFISVYFWSTIFFYHFYYILFPFLLLVIISTLLQVLLYIKCKQYKNNISVFLFFLGVLQKRANPTIFYRCQQVPYTWNRSTRLWEESREGLLEKIQGYWWQCQGVRIKQSPNANTSFATGDGIVQRKIFLEGKISSARLSTEVRK